ncbi:MAG: type I methionyl aminopeptidase [Opitutaceae bacterium]|nr:type I methionyl aminopeptidase [Opitutaceae bacterium]
MIPLKSAIEVEKMRDACRVAAEVLAELKPHVQAGVTTFEIDQIAKVLLMEKGATSACYQYAVGSRRFPSYICISVNDEVVHGIGRVDRIIQEGDIVVLDVVVSYRGYIGDNAYTVSVGKVSPEKEELLKVTEESLYKGIKFARVGFRVGDISHAIQKYVESHRFSIVRDFVGHGVGVSMHEEPQIPNYGRKNTGPRLKAGMTLAIEPMVNVGRSEVIVLDDGWTVVTRDRKASAHFEHTVLVTDEEPEILTIAGTSSELSR